MLYGNVSAVAGVNMCGYGHQQSDLPVCANDNHAEQQPAQKTVQKTVTVQRTLDKSGLEVKVRVPVAEFIGLVVSTQINQDGVLSSHLDLVHQDDELSHSLFSEQGNATIVDVWQSKAQEFGLPMFIRSGNGDLIPFSQKVEGIAGASTTPRRKLASQANRRARFNHKRK